MSNIKFSGRIYKEPEMRATPAGEFVLSWNMSIYTGKTKAGEYKKSEWIRVNSWGEDAKRLQNELKEKMVVTVEGQPQEPRTYVKDGVEKQAGLEVTAYRVALNDEFRTIPEEDSF
jgi:single-stranded DNA-binding protein